MHSIASRLWGFRSRIGRFKPIADYDWNWPKHVDRPKVEAAVQLDFLAEHRNVVLVAPQGLGKTMIAQNIAHQAVLQGHSVLFLTAAQLLLDLGAQESARGLDRRLRFYASVALLVVDEVGYLSFDPKNADLLFQVISRRYEKKSLVLTTNLAFQDWPSIFPNASCATALITASSTTPTSSPSRATATGCGRPSNARTRTPTTPGSHDRRGPNSRGSESGVAPMLTA